MTTPTTTTTPATLTSEARDMAVLDLLTGDAPSTHDEWNSYWAVVKALRAQGWQPSAEQKAILDETFRNGRKAGLWNKAPAKPVEATPAPKAEPTPKQVAWQRRKEALRADRKDRKGMAVTVSYMVNGTEVLRTKHATTKLAMQSITGNLAKVGGNAEVVVKHHSLRETMQGDLTAPVRNAAAHQSKRAAFQAKRKAQQALAPKAPPMADPVKVALQAALQSLTASSQGLTAAAEAISAAIAAL